MESQKDGIYNCSLCTAFICREDEHTNCQIIHKELNDKFENLCYNLDFTKKVRLESDQTLFSLCAIIDLNCKRCRQKIGFTPVSTTAQTNDLRDKIIISKERLVYSEANVKSENDLQAGREDSDFSLMKTEDKKRIRRKSFFLAKIEENISNMHLTIEKCKERYQLMLGFYRNMEERLESIEDHNRVTQSILANLSEQALTRKSKTKQNSENSGSKQRICLIYKPPTKNINRVEDIQKLLANPKQSDTKRKRKREDSDNNTNPYTKLLKPSN